MDELSQKVSQRSGSQKLESGTLKSKYGREIPEAIAESICLVHKVFPKERFLSEVLKEYEELELMARGRKMAQALRGCLPSDYEEAVEILLRSLGPPLDQVEKFGMSPFLYLPHVFFVGEYGLDFFEASMKAQYELTRRFTAEFSIRGYLEKYPEQTLERLREWTQDRCPHVRRLVSEGTRPRLPWAPRLRRFQADPAPVLVLLELLKDDPSLYVRRSVANNLNDIGKDHPQILASTAEHWLKDAPSERIWVVRHALRSAVKRGESGALAVLGVDKAPEIQVGEAAISPERPTIGSSVTISFELISTAPAPQSLLVDLRIHYRKASGQLSPKVFKLSEVSLRPDESRLFRKTVMLRQMTTRSHYPGEHKVEAVVNGRAVELGSFVLMPE